MKTSKLNKNYKVIFPEETVPVIDRLIEKYEFEKIEEEMFEQIDRIEDFRKKEEIFENLPIRQISRTVKEIAEGKTSLKDSVFILQQRLNISEGIAKKLVQDLKENVLVLVQKIPSKEEEVFTPSKPHVKSTEAESSIPSSSEESPSAKKIDTYREPIE